MQHNIAMRLYKNLLLFLFIYSSSAVALDYKVEVLIFENLYPDLDNEKWFNNSFTKRENAIDLIYQDKKPSVDNLAPYSVLASSSHYLSGVYGVLKRSKEYKPLLHIAWYQPSGVTARSNYVAIQKYYKDEVVDLRSGESNIQSDMIVDGYIQVRSGYYIQVVLDLIYFSKLPPENKIARTEEEWIEINLKKIPIPLKESRRVKLNEIHYFDNPLFGVFIRVSRL